MYAFQWRNVQFLVYFSLDKLNITFLGGHNLIGNSVMNPTWQSVSNDDHNA